VRKLIGTVRLLAAVLAILWIVSPARAQEEEPVDPESLGRESAQLPLQINGFAVANYEYRFSTDENSFEGSVLAVSFFKAFSDRLSLFGQIAVHREEESPFVEGEEEEQDPRAARALSEESEEGGSFETEIDNLQIAWAANARTGLQVVFGKFDSPIALERDDAPLNFQATPSFVIEFARPIKFSGVMARRAFSPRFEGYALLANGWDVSRDNNRAKTAALYAVWSPKPIAHFGLGLIHGAEKEDRTGDARTTGVATILVQQGDSWVWGEEFVYGREPGSGEVGGAAEWFGDVFFSHHRLGTRWAATVRVEYFDDIDGSRTRRGSSCARASRAPSGSSRRGWPGAAKTVLRWSARPVGALPTRVARSTSGATRRRGSSARPSSFGCLRSTDPSASALPSIRRGLFGEPR
jgi:hypothetical protein